MASDAEHLLDLTLEYGRSTASRSPEFDGVGAPVGRDPSAIAAEYVEVLRRVVGGGA